MRALSILLVPLALLGCGARDVPALPPAPPPEHAQDSVALIADSFWEWALRDSPEDATADGDHRFNDRLTDLSPAAFARREAEAKELQRRLDALGALEGEDAITADILRLELSATIDGVRLHLERIDVDSMDGPQVSFPRRMAMHPRRDARDIGTLLARYRAFPTYIDQYIANLRAGLAEKRTAPRAIVDRVISQLRDLLSAEPAKSRFARAADDVPALPEPEREKLRADLVAATEKLVYPAYRGLLDFLERDYRPAAREEVGLWALPDGAEIYAQAIWQRTTTRRTAAELHDLGKQELAKIEGEIRAIGARLGKPGERRDIEEWLSSDPAQRFSDRAQMLSEYKKTVDRLRTRLPEEFTTQPPEMAIEPMAEFMEKNAPPAYYDFPLEDGSRKGTFYLNTWQPETRFRYKMEALAAHEGVPGHHLQISIALGLKSLHQVRRKAGITAYSEGWGLYAERLVDEMGLYSDERARFGMLTQQAFRASRLVVDTGIHAMKWTREQAIDYVLAHTAMQRRDVEIEIDRYIVWPAQGMAYTVGALEIFAARADAQAAMGPRFSRKAFHDRLLGSGAIPIETMRREIAKWARR